MSLKELQNSLQAGNIPGLILLYGQEGFFVEQGEKVVLDALVEPANRDFNYSLFHGKDFNALDVVEQSRTFPVFADKRLVVIRNIHEAKSEQLDGLLDYVNSPVPETILLVTAEKIDARRKLFQQFKKMVQPSSSRKFMTTSCPASSEISPNQGRSLLPVRG
jgi:DNA polymerase-3 subunit delta